MHSVIIPLRIVDPSYPRMQLATVPHTEMPQRSMLKRWSGATAIVAKFSGGGSMQSGLRSSISNSCCTLLAWVATRGTHKHTEESRRGKESERASNNSQSVEFVITGRMHAMIVRAVGRFYSVHRFRLPRHSIIASVIDISEDSHIH